VCHALLLLGGLCTVPPHILQSQRDGAARFQEHGVQCDWSSALTSVAFMKAAHAAVGSAAHVMRQRVFVQ
jgi:hypothetical protein